MSNDLKDSDRSLLGRLLDPCIGVHAVLFYGAEAAPILDTAESLAKGWLCLTPTPEGACGECRSCNAFVRGNQVDYKKIVPKGASAIIKISAISPRQAEPGDDAEPSLQEFFRTAPLFGNRKVALIVDADRMNSSAANSLLKMLEEPHPYAKIILTTTALGEILPTVLSRCVNVPVPMENEPAEQSPATQFARQIAVEVGSAGPEFALAFGERLRQAGEMFQSERNVGVRNANALALLALSAGLLSQYPTRPEWAQAAIEAHRRVLGNANSTLVFDSLFARFALAPK